MTSPKKPILIILSLALVCLSTSAQQTNIKGSVQTINKGEIAIWIETPKGIDTICVAPIVDEKYDASLTLKEAQIANLSVLGYDGFTRFVLTPRSRYSIDLKKNGPVSIKTDSPLQNTLQEYQQLVQDYNEKLREKQQEIQTATAERKFKTVAALKEQMEAQREDAKRDLNSIVDKNRDNVLGTYIITASVEKETNLNTLRSQYNELSPQAQQTTPAKMLAHRIASLAGVEVNAQAPDFQLPDREGKNHSLYEQTGELIILDFWASWCGPCRRENPNMISLYNNFKNKGLTIISISIDTSESAWHKAVENDKLTWLQLIENQKTSSIVTKLYNVESVPAIFILNKEKQIIAKNLRHENLRAFVEEQLNAASLE